MCELWGTGCCSRRVWATCCLDCSASDCVCRGCLVRCNLRRRIRRRHLLLLLLLVVLLLLLLVLVLLLLLQQQHQQLHQQ